MPYLRRNVLETFAGELMSLKLTARDYLAGLAYFAALAVIIAELYYLFK